MSIYRWRDPTTAYRSREYTWERHLDGRITCTGLSQGNKARWGDTKLVWTWPEWAELATCAGHMFEEGRVYRYEAKGCYVAFGWEKRARRDYPEVMYIRGVWDHAEIMPINMPAAHWADVLGCMNIEPPVPKKADRLGLLMDVPMVEPPPEPPPSRRERTQREREVAEQREAVSRTIRTSDLARLWEATPDVATQSTEEP